MRIILVPSNEIWSWVDDLHVHVYTCTDWYSPWVLTIMGSHCAIIAMQDVWLGMAKFRGAAPALKNEGGGGGRGVVPEEFYLH